MGLGSTGSAFVGRSSELARLDGVLSRARDGRPVTVLCCGEAGVGKSRLVSEMFDRARESGMLAATGHCTTVGRSSPAFAPFSELFRTLSGSLSLGGTPADTPVDRVIRRFLSGRVETPASELDEQAHVGPAGQALLFERLLEVVETAAGPDGLLLVVEDLHWADAESRGLFEFLHRNLGDAPVALVATLRTDERQSDDFVSWFAEILRHPRVQRVEVEPFGHDELAELLAGVIGHAPSSELVDEILERSGGNAFLAEELLSARARGLEVTSTVRSVVQAKTSHLSPTARELLWLAAVAGVSVDHELLAEAAGDVASTDLLDGLRELVECHLLVNDRSGYRFRHALTRDVVDGELLAGERQRLHGQLAAALSRRQDIASRLTETPAQVLAEHWFAAGQADRALAASMEAAAEAAGAVAFAAALAQCERVLDLWDVVAEPDTVAGADHPTVHRRAAEFAGANGDDDRALRHLDTAIEQLERVGDTSALAETYLEKGQCLWRAGRRAERVEWTARAIALIPPIPASRRRAFALRQHAAGLADRSQYAVASSIAALALDAARDAGDRREEALAHASIAVCLLMTSTDGEAAVRHDRCAVTILCDLADCVEAVCAYGSAVDTLMRLGRFGRAVEMAQEAIEVTRRLDAVERRSGTLTYNHAQAHFLAGRWGECEEQLASLRNLRPSRGVADACRADSSLLDAMRGRQPTDDAIHDENDADIDIGDASVSATFGVARAQRALDAGDVEAAHRIVSDAVATATSTSIELEVSLALTLADLALRVEADRAELGRARRDQQHERAARDALRTMAAATLDIRLRAVGAAHRARVTGYHRAIAAAEGARAEARADPALWARAVAAAIEEGAPHRVAYARFREAEALLAAGDRAGARATLEQAHRITEALGAVPLRSSIESLARRARLALGDVGSPPTAPETEVSTHGLSRREVDVLRLVADGCTNPQIGEALYISPKTASHHVSSILTKLGVASRFEAAVAAQRLGLTSEATDDERHRS